MTLLIWIIVTVITIKYAIYPLLCDMFGLDIDQISFKSHGWEERELNRQLLEDETLTKEQREHIERRLEVLNNENSN